MLIKGLQKLTLLDFPEKMACTLFTFGCNFRCPFCHNASLVLSDRADGAIIEEEDFFRFLRSRRGILEGVCISGGEPTLQPDLPAFIRRIRDLGFAVKLDTNGYRPAVLRALIDEGLVDYVAMDIKNSLSRYPETVGIARFDTAPIEESMDLLMEDRVPFEFRTTLVRGLHTPESIAEIGRRLAGGERFFLQTFEDSGDLIADGLSGFDREETDALLAVLCNYVPNAQIRG
ncbi:MAG: anaerobic ribonucleoside-triphosphate reductase activating protein [Clostridia bacterium]|nr:anaerobic ribonucleoside-triphosphate reductase activating protein [Clostridia bacterium]